MALIGRYNSLQVVKQADFGLYLDGGSDGEILLPNRYVPKDTPTEIGDWLNVFVYLDSADRLIATTERPKAQVGEFASLKVAEINSIGIFLDWGLPKDLLLPFSEEKQQLQVGNYCVVHLYLDKHTRRITATARLDRYLDKTPPRYQVGQPVEFLAAEATPMGVKVIIDNQHWALVHKNELFRPLRVGFRDQGFIKEIRADGKISLSLQAVGKEAPNALNDNILKQLHDNHGVLYVNDKSDPAEISHRFGVSKGNFKKAIGGLYKQGLIVILPDRIELASSAE
ncbi:S1-like domain-containing RNA-binding protein [Pseudomonas sp. LS44]|uniref:CvfB family protein n=1 Tax=Pseudomonas sp. LS44 TaxID=1357074 RepID=UPI00215A5FBE|nr:S1-like domain-containing RNA-binding protein [Pseudomonas sp. LS44]UVE18945.1 S1-like domain-containing RNA-binding protein [Pseudomonas sp. LS44]